MFILYQIAKILRIVGFVTAIGITLATFAAYNQFWKLYATNREQGLAAFRAFASLQLIGLIGLVVVLIAGVVCWH